MGNGNSTYGGGQDFAQLLRRFREVDGTYQSAPDAEKEKYFPRRHAALMMLLGTPPRTRDEIAEVMSVALDELAKDLMVPGPVPEAVAAALANCLRAIENVDLEPRPASPNPIECPSLPRRIPAWHRRNPCFGEWGAHASQKLCHMKGLGQIVVRPRINQGHLV